MNKDTIAWVIAIGGITLEIIIASIDWWSEVPHYVFHIGDSMSFTRVR